MKNIKQFAQKYVDWVIKLGRFKFSLLGILILAVLALCTYILLNLLFMGEIYWSSVGHSLAFGLISAPFVIYFFTLLVERLELSRLALTKSVDDLQQEIKERILVEQRLAQINHDKSALMATISHELRTPLNGIIGLSRMLLDGDLSDEQRNYLKTINVSAVSLGHIFNEIIDLEKIDAHRIELDRRETDFYAVLNDINNIARLMAEQQHLRFELKCGQNLPCFLMLDATRLSQVLWNLISNATKFTEKGTVSLTVERLAADQFSFVVADSGKGIPAQDIDKIFAMYYQVQDASRKYRTGSGIGLAISKSIAQLMGGDLTVYSEEGNGSKFTLTITAQEVSRPVEQTTKLPVADLRVLLVEDVELNVTIAKSLLEKLGYRVDVAMTGKRAIELFERQHYHLLLLDIQLPDMSGVQVAQYLRQNYEHGRYDFLPPLIALTANVMQSKAEYRRQGMDDVLRKPLSVDELTHCLIEYFGEDEGREKRSPSSLQGTLETDFDFVIINELVDMLGSAFVKDNLLLFKQTMPTYMQALTSSFADYLQGTGTQLTVAAHAHKIKGAAAAIGLKGIQDIAEKAQHNEAPDWQAGIADWIAKLENQWPVDVERLARWLDNKIKGLIDK